METVSNAPTPVNIELPGGLVVRRATPADRESLIAINNERLGLDSKVEVAYLTEGELPGVRLEDFLVVVEPGGRVVSALCMIEQELRVGKTILKIGNPEFVSTMPEYEGQGLIRKQFEVLDRWQRERGYAFSLIMGIPFYYRLFGYEYALENYRPGFLYPAVHLPKLAEVPDLEVRLIEESDAPLLAQMYAETAAEADIALTLPDAGWKWSARTRRMADNLIEDWVALDHGKPVAVGRLYLHGTLLTVFRFGGELAGQQAIVKKALALPDIEKVGVGTVRNSPLARWFASLEPEQTRSYGNYVRVIDPALAFRQLGPEFESRLANSRFAGLRREVEISFYRYGVVLAFEEGKLARVDHRSGAGRNATRISFPPDVLPKILLGYRSLDELANVFPDIEVRNEEDWALMQVLFPPLISMLNFFI